MLYVIEIDGISPSNNYWDFGIFYEVGKQIYIDPESLYDLEDFFYLPNAAVFFALTISLLPFSISFWSFYILNIVFGIIFIIEFDRILKLLNIKSMYQRLIFLLLISNGYFLYGIFSLNQTKLLVGSILIFIIRKEIEFRQEEKEKDLKYKLIVFSLFIFIVGMAPSFILLFIIYIFHDIRIKELFSKKHLKDYGLIIGLFLGQNFLFLIYPPLILDFFDGLEFGTAKHWGNNPFLFDVEIPKNLSVSLPFFSSIGLIIITLVLLLNKRLKFETKVGYFSFIYLFLGFFSGFGLTHILFGFSLFIYLPYFQREKKLLAFIKKNWLILFNFLLIGVILVFPKIPNVVRLFSFTRDFPMNVLLKLRYVLLFCLLGFSLSLILLIENRNLKTNFCVTLFIIYLTLILYFLIPFYIYRLF